jgi:hypothetical protein
MKNLSLTFKDTRFIDPKELILNDEKFNILGTCKNYDELFESIQKEGIITPLLVNNSNIVISGNLRLCIALELKLDLVPVTYVNVDESDIIKMLHTDIYREKSMTEKLMIYFILKEKYQIPKGGRTDLFKELKEKKKYFDGFNPLSVHISKAINGFLESYTQEEIYDTIQELEETGRELKVPTISKKLEEKYPKVSNNKVVDTTRLNTFNINYEITIDYDQFFKLENLKEELSKINKKGGSLFVTNVPMDKDWRLIYKMKEGGLILYTFKCNSNNNFTYQFMFLKSDKPPVKQIEHHSFMFNTFNEYQLVS